MLMAEEKKEEYINEAKRLGLKIALPTVGKSHATDWETSQNSKELYAPFIEVKGIGAKTADKLTKQTDPNKGFFLKNKTVRLVPENRDMEPMTLKAKDVKIIGKVVGILRKL